MTMRDFSLQRRRSLLGMVAMGAASIAVAAKPQILEIQVWKDPNCGCCNAWIEHLEKNGFSPSVIDAGNNAARARLGLPQKFASCDLRRCNEKSRIVMELAHLTFLEGSMALQVR